LPNKEGFTVAKTRKPPLRSCVGCGEPSGKRDLIRVVRTPEGVILDPTGKRNGRGAYVHPDVACLSKAIAGRLARSLGVELSARDIAALQDCFGTVLATPPARKPMIHRAQVPLPPELIARDRRGAVRVPSQKARRTGGEISAAAERKAGSVELPTKR